jgi:hypothetical protein
MKRARVGVIAAAILAVATIAWAQKPPDFSGTWTPDPPPEAAGGGGRGGGGPMTVKQTATDLTVERTTQRGAVSTTASSTAQRPRSPWARPRARP